MNDPLLHGFADELCKAAARRSTVADSALAAIEGDVESVGKARGFFGGIGQIIKERLGLGDDDVIESPRGRRLAKGVKSYMVPEYISRASAALGNFPGPHSSDEIAAAFNQVLGEHAPDMLAPGSQLEVRLKGWGPSWTNVGLGPGGVSEVTAGQLGTAYHEAGHAAAIEKVYNALGPGALGKWLKAYELSSQYGPMAGLAAIPPVVLEKQERPSRLATAAPALALLPSLPHLVEEGRASYYGGRAAAKAGKMLPFLKDVLPSSSYYLARAGAIPFGLYMINRMRNARADELEAEGLE